MLEKYPLEKAFGSMFLVSALLYVLGTGMEHVTGDHSINAVPHLIASFGLISMTAVPAAYIGLQAGTLWSYFFFDNTVFRDMYRPRGSATGGI